MTFLFPYASVVLPLVQTMTYSQTIGKNVRNILTQHYHPSGPDEPQSN